MNIKIRLDQGIVVESVDKIYFPERLGDGSIKLVELYTGESTRITRDDVSLLDGHLIHLVRRSIGQYAHIKILTDRKKVYTVSSFEDVKTDDVFKVSGETWVVAAALEDRICLLGPPTEHGTFFAVVFKETRGIQWSECSSERGPKYGFFVEDGKLHFVAPRGARRL